MSKQNDSTKVKLKVGDVLLERVAKPAKWTKDGKRIPQGFVLKKVTVAKVGRKYFELDSPWKPRIPLDEVTGNHRWRFFLSQEDYDRHVLWMQLRNRVRTLFDPVANVLDKMSVEDLQMIIVVVEGAGVSDAK